MTFIPFLSFFCTRISIRALFPTAARYFFPICVYSSSACRRECEFYPQVYRSRSCGGARERAREGFDGACGRAHRQFGKAQYQRGARRGCNFQEWSRCGCGSGRWTIVLPSYRILVPSLAPSGLTCGRHCNVHISSFFTAFKISPFCRPIKR